MLNPEALRLLVRAEPFRPFRIFMNSGKTYDIRHPEMIGLGRSHALLYHFTDPEMFIHDRFDMVSTTLMEHTEFLDAIAPSNKSSTG